MEPGIRANLVGLGVNVGLAVAKFVVGTLAGSAALVADGFNSAGDTVATLVATIGYREAQKPPDATFHYGHGNVEVVAGLIVATILFGTGVLIAIEGTLSAFREPEAAPGALALVVAGGTAVVKEALYQYTTRVGRALNAPSLLATARDHRADVFAATAVFAGVAGARFGFAALDPIAAVVIGLYIALFSLEPLRTNINTLMDIAPPELADDIRRVAHSVPEVRESDSIRVHPMGSYNTVDLEIYLPGDLSLFEAHEIAHTVQDAIRTQVEHVRDVRVHVNPTGLPEE